MHEVNKQQSDTLDLMYTALRTIDQYPDDMVHIYTDGSATSGIKDAGYGVRIQLPDKSCKELSGPCGRFCSNYEAEAAAIESALTEMDRIYSDYPERKEGIVIFTDAMSVLQALESDSIKDRKIAHLSAIISNFINFHEVEVTLQWIPGHTNIPGNDRADLLAKRGAGNTQTKSSASITTARQTIKQHKKKIWLDQWANTTKGRPIFQHMPSPNPKDEINKLKRHEQTTIFRLRSEHIQLNSHLKRIGVKTSPECPLCGCLEETVRHHLFECSALDDLRSEYLPPKPDTANTLFGPKDILKNTHIFHVMANIRRARAQ